MCLVFNYICYLCKKMFFDEDVWDTDQEYMMKFWQAS